MISDWHKEDARQVIPSTRKGVTKEMPEDFPSLIEKFRLDGWSKCVCFSKAGASEGTTKRWLSEHPSLRAIADKFKIKRG